MSMPSCPGALDLLGHRKVYRKGGLGADGAGDKEVEETGPGEGGESWIRSSPELGKWRWGRKVVRVRMGG